MPDPYTVQREDLQRIAKMARFHLDMMAKAEGRMFPACDKRLKDIAVALEVTLKAIVVREAE